MSDLIKLGLSISSDKVNVDSLLRFMNELYENGYITWEGDIKLQFHTDLDPVMGYMNSEEIVPNSLENVESIIRERGAKHLSFEINYDEDSKNNTIDMVDELNGIGKEVGEIMGDPSIHLFGSLLFDHLDRYVEENVHTVCEFSLSGDHGIVDEDVFSGKYEKLAMEKADKFRSFRDIVDRIFGGSKFYYQNLEGW